MPARPARPVMERILQRVEVDSNDCWIFTGALQRNGYGCIGVRECEPCQLPKMRLRVTHRVAYEHIVGPIPQGLQLDHLCHNADLMCPGDLACRHRACCNPDHLEPVTPAENMRRHGERYQKRLVLGLVEKRPGPKKRVVAAA